MSAKKIAKIKSPKGVQKYKSKIKHEIGTSYTKHQNSDRENNKFQISDFKHQTVGRTRMVQRKWMICDADWLVNRLS